MSQVGGTTTDYLYSADKTKLASRNAAGCGYDYLGSLVYKTDGGGRKLESAAFDGGRIKRLNSPESGKSDLPLYDFADHLGSVRVTTNHLGAVLGRNDYYPFGKRWHDDGSAAYDRWLFNGKELQPDFDFLDYGARMYDPELGRWTSSDLMAEKNADHSPYAFCANNPVVNVDPDGQDWFSYMRYRYDENGNVIGGDRVYEYSTEFQSQADLNRAGISGKYLGLTYTDEKNGVYYGLYGSAFFLRSPYDEWNLRGEMVRNIDNAIINSYKADYQNNNPVDPMFNEYHNGGTNMRVSRVITKRNVSLAQQYRVFDYQGGAVSYHMANNQSNATFSWGNGKFVSITGYNISTKPGVHAIINERTNTFIPVIWTFPDKGSWLEVRQKTDNLLKGRTW